MPSIKQFVFVVALVLAVLPKPSTGDVELAASYAYFTLPPDREPVPVEEQEDTEEEGFGYPSAQWAPVSMISIGLD
ncbi:hypothetical protein TNCT_224211 [Trichonephila clavata]|uniref:Secreted protein n=1 Tax=Trichonephila clavata TaxID=2740835 RepID=A0A8X6GZ26_TRICU|nr:hypothetical protein TNCT_224211 [Trichonephila clavata]